MSETPNTTEPEDEDAIIWSWTGSDGAVHEEFEDGLALAYLLKKEVVFLNSRWWRNEDKEQISVAVNCNDVFAWGCADAEPLPYIQIRPLYERVIKDPDWGAAKWCIEQRGQMPQKPVENAIKKAGLWDVDETKVRPNTQNAQVQALFAAVARRETSAQEDGGA